MKYSPLLLVIFLTGCGNSLTYMEVKELETKCKDLGGKATYRAYGMVGEGKVSDVDCQVNGIIFTQGKY